MSTLNLAIAALATYRLVRLVTVDRITEPLRDWAEMRAPWAGYLTTCSWCSAVWLAPIPSACLVLWPGNRVLAVGLLALAASAGAGLLAGLADRLED